MELRGGGGGCRSCSPRRRRPWVCRSRACGGGQSPRSPWLLLDSMHRVAHGMEGVMSNKGPILKPLEPLRLDGASWRGRRGPQCRVWVPGRSAAGASGMAVAATLAPAFPRGEPSLSLYRPSSRWHNCPFAAPHVPPGAMKPRDPASFHPHVLAPGLAALCVLGKVWQQWGPCASLTLPNEREALLLGQSGGLPTAQSCPRGVMCSGAWTNQICLWI